MTPPAFPLLLPGLDASSSEWVLFTALWLVAAVATFARFFGLATGTLTARLQATPAGMSFGIPGIILIFLSIIGHFAVMAAIIVEMGSDGPLADLANMLGGVLTPIGNVMEMLLPPLAILSRLHWDFAILAWLLIMAAEALLYPGLKLSGHTLRHKQNDILASIERKAHSTTNNRGYNY